MKMSIARVISTVTRTVAIAVFAMLVSSGRVYGQYTVTTVQTREPAVIGYAAERAGLFGFQTAYRPIVGTVPVTKTVIVQQRPAYVAPTYVAPTYVAPAYSFPAYTPAPVSAYLAPFPPAPVPVTSYYTPIYRAY